MTKLVLNTGERISEYTDRNSFIEQKGTYKMQIEFLKNSVGNLRSKVIVDCACGEGYGSHMLYQQLQPKTLYGIDIDYNTVNYCSLKYDGPIFFQDNILNLDKIKDNYDIFISNQTLEHLTQKDQFEAISKVYKKLSKGGYFICAVPNKPVYQKYSQFNKFHLNELDFENLCCLIESFSWNNTILYGQLLPSYQSESIVRKSKLLHKFISLLPKKFVYFLQKLFNPKLQIEDIKTEEYTKKNDAQYKILIAICQK